jgi:hypothetical protein
MEPCNQCGAEPRKGDRFCLSCGTILNPVEPGADINIEVGVKSNKYQIIRTKGGKRRVIKRGKVKKGVRYFEVKGIKDRVYFNDPKQLIRIPHEGRHGKITYTEELIYDENFSEPLNANSAIPEYSDIIERDLINSYEDQLIEVATVFTSQFNLDKRTLTIMGVCLALMTPLGLGINSVFHLVPSTIVRWVP